MSHVLGIGSTVVRRRMMVDDDGEIRLGQELAVGS